MNEKEKMGAAVAPDPKQIEADLEQVLPWYASTQGPGLSSTLVNIAGSLLPMINMALLSRGVQIGPDWLDLTITLGVFGFFAAKAAIAHMKAVKTLGASVIRLGGAHTISKFRHGRS